ncbi:MAG TPA: AzlD domain-containing protein [Terriglobales bacterium]|nr:AzlD domain-containing protein [Terriglobales bacterium]
MPDPQILAAILAVGATSYAMRAGGFIAAGLLPRQGLLQRLLKLAPGNLFATFAAAGMVEGGWPSCAGCLGAILTMAVTKKEWAALAIGFALTALTAAMRS